MVPLGPRKDSILMQFPATICGFLRFPGPPRGLEGRKVPTKSLLEQEAPKIGAQKRPNKRGIWSRQKTSSAREKSFRTSDPIEKKKMKGTFP